MDHQIAAPGQWLLQLPQGLARITPMNGCCSLFQCLHRAGRPLPTKALVGEGQVQGLGVELQPPPLQLQLPLLTGLQQDGGVGASTHAELQHPQRAASSEVLEPGRHEKGLFGLLNGPPGTVKRLAVELTPEAETAVVAAARPQRCVSCAAIVRVHPRSLGKTPRRLRFAQWWSRRWRSTPPPPGSWPRGDRFRYRPGLL